MFIISLMHWQLMLVFFKIQTNTVLDEPLVILNYSVIVLLTIIKWCLVFTNLRNNIIYQVKMLSSIPFNILFTTVLDALRSGYMFNDYPRLMHKFTDMISWNMQLMIFFSKTTKLPNISIVAYFYTCHFKPVKTMFDIRSKFVLLTLTIYLLLTSP